MESSLLLSSPRPLRPFHPLRFRTGHRRHASFRGKHPASLPLPPLARGGHRLRVVGPRAAHEAFDGGVRSQNSPPGVGRGGARRRSYREAQGEAAVPPVVAAAKAIAPYVVPAGAVLMLSFEDSHMEGGSEYTSGEE